MDLDQTSKAAWAHTLLTSTSLSVPTNASQVAQSRQEMMAPKVRRGQLSKRQPEAKTVGSP